MSPTGNDSQNTPILRADDDDDEKPVLDIEDIDLEALAEEVYALLQRELRLERERQGWRPSR